MIRPLGRHWLSLDSNPTSDEDVAVVGSCHNKVYVCSAKPDLTNRTNFLSRTVQKWYHCVPWKELLKEPILRWLNLCKAAELAFQYVCFGVVIQKRIALRPKRTVRYVYCRERNLPVVKMVSRHRFYKCTWFCRIGSRKRPPPHWQFKKNFVAGNQFFIRFLFFRKNRKKWSTTGRFYTNKISTWRKEFTSCWK
jgi:hypothetical protein